MADDNGRPANHWSRTVTICRGALAGVCKRIAQIMANAHKTSFAMYYAYLISLSVVLQDNWAEMEQYIPEHMRHRIIMGLTIIAIADKLRRAAKATRPPDAGTQ